MPLTLKPMTLRFDDGVKWDPVPPISYEVHGLPGRSAIIHLVGRVWQMGSGVVAFAIASGRISTRGKTHSRRSRRTSLGPALYPTLLLVPTHSPHSVAAIGEREAAP